MGFLGAVVVKNLPANARDVRDLDFIPGSRRSPGGGHGNPLQYSCLENPMDREAWWAPVHGVANSQTHWSDWLHNKAHILHHRKQAGSWAWILLITLLGRRLQLWLISDIKYIWTHIILTSLSRQRTGPGHQTFSHHMYWACSWYSAATSAARSTTG